MNRMEIFKKIKEHLGAIGFTKPDVGFHTEQVLRTSQRFLAIVLQCLYMLFDVNTTKHRRHMFHAPHDSNRFGPSNFLLNKEMSLSLSYNEFKQT